MSVGFGGLPQGSSPSNLSVRCFKDQGDAMSKNETSDQSVDDRDPVDAAIIERFGFTPQQVGEMSLYL